MKLRLLSLVALLLLVACAPALADVTGTKWSGVDSDGDAYTVWFRSGGQLSYTSPTGHLENATTWKQMGDVITWEFNKGYARYTARVDGDVMKGTAVNIKDHKWTFEWKRVTAVPKLEGTSWRGKDAAWTMRFQPGGVLALSGEKDAQGTWEQHGDEVDIVLGRLHLHGWISEQTLAGTLSSGEGEASSWSAVRTEP